jgi:phosphoglycerate dehydrogenase-like enzyme
VAPIVDSRKDHAGRPRVGIALNHLTRLRYFEHQSVERLEREAEVVWLEFDGPARATDEQPGDYEQLMAFVQDLDALVVSHGCPRVTEEIIASAPRLRLIGDTHGDRFAERIDVAAGRRAGVAVVDTTNGSSDPVAEWALALSMVGLRNAGALFRRLIAGEVLWPDRRVFERDPGYLVGELTGKTVGMIACGHVGRRLLELLHAFHCQVLVYDPYAPAVLAEVYDLNLTTLQNVLSGSDVVICLAPLTSQTRGLIGREQVEAMRAGTVFVNVSRGMVVQTDPLVERLRRGDLIACLDVFDPEPIPADHAVRALPNVFLSPHIAGVTAACEPRFFDYMVDEVLRVLAGHRPRHELIPREPVPW